MHLALQIRDSSPRSQKIIIWNTIVQHLYDQEASKHDFLVSNQHLTMRDDGTLDIQAQGNFKLAEFALGQMATHLNIPRDYVRRMAGSATGLLAHNINHWLQQTEAKRTVRTLGNNLRTYLSDRYKILDHLPLMQAISPSIMQNGLQIVSANISEEKLYLKAISPRLNGEVRRGMRCTGVVISNSEIGAGSLAVKPLIFRLVCTNGMVMDTATKRYHVGKRNEFEDFEEYISDEARIAEEKSLFLKLRDVIQGSLREEFFNAQLDKLHFYIL
ncbi:MAG: hypothetical protein HQM12_15915 [SAR324 cluster bacterium]|nr:hypothetical protein [SAR324 cluster bacterium]